MANFLYIPSNKQVTLFGAASATVATDYDANWLLDGNPGRPARGTSGSFSSTLSFTAGLINTVVMANHNLGAVTIGGGLSGTIAASSTQSSGIPLSTFASVTPATVSGFTLAGTTTAAAWVVGGVYAGEGTSLTLPIYSSDEIEYDDLARPLELDLASIPPYDPGFAPRRNWSATWPALTQAEVDGLVSAFGAQRARTRPTLIIRATSTNDAMLGFITRLSHNGSESPNHYEVSLSFEEIPRMRWT